MDKLFTGTASIHYPLYYLHISAQDYLLINLWIILYKTSSTSLDKNTYRLPAKIHA